MTGPSHPLDMPVGLGALPTNRGRYTKGTRRNTKSTKGIFLCLLSPLCVTRLQLLVFWTKFFGAHIPLLAEEGCPRHPKNGSVPICRGRGGQFGAPSKGQPN